MVGVMRAAADQSPPSTLPPSRRVDQPPLCAGAVGRGGVARAAGAGQGGGAGGGAGGGGGGRRGVVGLDLWRKCEGEAVEGCEGRGVCDEGGGCRVYVTATHAC